MRHQTKVLCDSETIVLHLANSHFAIILLLWAALLTSKIYYEKGAGYELRHYLGQTQESTCEFLALAKALFSTFPSFPQTDLETISCQ